MDLSFHDVLDTNFHVDRLFVVFVIKYTCFVTTLYAVIYDSLVKKLLKFQFVFHCWFSFLCSSSEDDNVDMEGEWMTGMKSEEVVASLSNFLS